MQHLAGLSQGLCEEGVIVGRSAGLGVGLEAVLRKFWFCSAQHLVSLCI